MRKTEVVDIPIRPFMVRSTHWHEESSSRHRIAVVVAMVVAAILLFAFATRIHADEFSELKVAIKKLDEQTQAKASPALAAFRCLASGRFAPIA